MMRLTAKHTTLQKEYDCISFVSEYSKPESAMDQIQSLAPSQRCIKGMPSLKMKCYAKEKHDQMKMPSIDVPD